MEDYVVAENRKVDGYELGLYAIFDGHSGRNVAKYLQAHLFDNILNEVHGHHCPQPQPEAFSSSLRNVPRVDGQLAMSRAFGDARLKDHISSEPDLKIVTIDRDDTDSIILASDGLWKVMSNQDACDCIRGVEDPKEAAKTLIAEALARGSKDDISCIVVMID
ncbi:unnamed protein product [Linum tenue]|uniref:PPM-type phosphatase domain-containing protein n=1 Tax=Linum tenue TaxID=586396 RepID=A0AAV0QKB0_9ROSI|nr:unnamed protein product [Linum tenue]